MAFTDSAEALPVDPMAAMDPMVAAVPAPQVLYDLTIKRCTKSGQLKVKSIAPEDFGLDPTALKVSETEGRFYYDKSRYTRSDAKLKWPKKADIIDELPVYTTATDATSEKQARDQRFWSFRETSVDKSTEEIEVHECYVKIDYDNDDVAEWRQVCIGGYAGGRAVLSNEEWSGPLPYDSITPDPMPHRYRGRSVFDDVAPIQRVKTVIMRSQLDNAYLVNSPVRGVDPSRVENLDAVTSPKPGSVALVNGNPAEVIADYVIPPVFEKMFPLLEYWDMTMEKRTGVSRSTMAMDTDTLQYQTATAVNATQSTAFSKVETYARNIAECGGLKELFGKLLKLFVQNQKSVKHIKVGQEFVKLDPRGWNADMRVTINVGLGAGNRDRDLMTLGGIMQKQELGIQVSGDPFNPILNIGHWLDTGRKMVETAGLKNPETYFPAITQEQVKMLSQMKAANPPQSPEDKKVAADMQIASMKVQADQQRDQNRAQLDQLQFQQKAQIESTQAQADIATQDRKTSSEIALAERRAQLEERLALLEHDLKVRESNNNLAIKQQEHLMRRQESEAKAEAEANADEPEVAEAKAAVSKRRKTEKTAKDADSARRDEESRRRDETTQAAMAGLMQAMDKLATVMAAPTDIVRDPKTGRVAGQRKRIS